MIAAANCGLQRATHAQNLVDDKVSKEPTG
jgi:hypothetical protein